MSDVVVITGASGGVGRATARRFAQDGAKIALLARGEAGLEGADAAFEDESYLERVMVSTGQAQAIGVTGIPGFLLDRRLLVLGAQPREVFEQAFAQLSGA